MKFGNYMTLEFPSKSSNESFARTAVACFAAQLDPNLEELGDIRTAVSEAVTNCIVHAYRDTVGEIQIKVEILDTAWVRISVRDRGCGIEDVRRAREPLYTTDREGERSGMGFTVMESFTDGVRVSSKPGRGTTVTMVKVLSELELDT